MSVPSAPNIYIRPRALLNSVFLYWRPPTDLGGSPILNYTVTCVESTYNQTFAPTVNRITVSELTTGTDYTFKITATNSTGTSTPAVYRTVQVGLPPGGARNVEANEASSTSAIVNWNFSTNTGEAPTHWFVLSAIPSTLGAAPIVKQSAHGYELQRTVYNLTTGIPYRILVQAVNDVGYAPRTALSELFTVGPVGPQLSFSPSEIPGLLYWGDMSLLSGPTVSSVPNQGNYNDPVVTLTGTGTVTQTLNGKNVLSLNTSQSFVGSALNLPNFTLFTVARKNTAAGRVFTDGDLNLNVYGYWGDYKASFNLHPTLFRILFYGNPTAAILNDTPTWDIQMLSKWNDTNGLNAQYNWNGTTLLQGTSATYPDKNTGLLTNVSINTLEPSACDIAEILIFESALSTEEIQLVEGYLASKWGLRANLPASHPYKSTPPQSTTHIYWRPTLLSGCQLWLDSSDSSSIQKTGSAITTWSDKSGNSNNATAVGEPIISNQAVVFDGTSSYFTLPNGTFPYGNTSYNYYIVVKPTNLSSSEVIIRAGGGDGSQSRCDLITNGDGSTIRSDWYYTYIQAAAIQSQNNLIEMSCNGTTRTIQINTLVVSDTPPLRYQDNTSNTIGAQPDGTFKFTGTISEIVVYNRALTPEEKNITEGYLAWKWGFQGSLPQDHPFALKAPTPTQKATFNPLDVFGCQVWLDGADQTTIQLNGSNNVTQWSDKSGRSNNATTLFQTLTSSPAGLGFDGQAYFTLPDGSIPYNNSSYSIYVVAIFTGDGGIMGAGPQSRNSGASLSIESIGNHLITNWNNNNFSIAETITNNIPMLYDSLYQSGGNRTVFLNGVASGNDTPGTRTQANTYNYIGITTDGLFMNGVISEILVYSINHTPAQRQAIEGYLAWKWNIQLPSAHPFYSNPPLPNHQTSWSPTSISPLSLWLDGQGVGTNPGTPVTTWYDKSEYKYHATQPILANAPSVAVGGGVLFNPDNSNQLVFDNQMLLLPTTTCFFVTSPSSTNNCYFYGTSNGTSELLMNYGETTPTILQFQISQTVGEDGAFVTPGASLPQINLFNYTRTADKSNIGYYMGSEVFNNPLTATPPPVYMFVLGSGGGSAYFGGTIYEMIFYNKALSNTERQVVEGYLAWKWGFQASMAPSHPFYSEAPTPNQSTTWQPTTLTGLNLWIDSDDRKSVQTINNKVQNVLDKSTYTNNMTSKTGVISIDKNVFNGRPSMYLSQSYFVGAMEPITTPQFTTFAIGTLNPSSAAAARILGFGAANTNDFDSNNFAIALSRNEATGLMTLRNTIRATASIPAFDVPFIAYSVQQSNTESIAVNGALTPSTTNTEITDNFNITQYGIGTNTNTVDPSYYTGAIAEVVVFNTVLTQYKRQIVEGYLAWKWGIQDKLPATHPFLNRPPTLNEPETFTPPVAPVTQLILSSDTTDTGSNPQTVTVNGSITNKTIQSKYSTYFNNDTANYLSLPFTPTQQFTITYWFNVKDTQGYDAWSLSSSATGTAAGINPDIYNGNQSFNLATTTDTFNAGGWYYPYGKTSGTWHHVALTVDTVGGVAKSYLNGVYKKKIPITGTLTNNSYLLLGKAGDDARAYNGYLSQFCVYDVALDSQQIQYNYNNITPPVNAQELLVQLKAVDYSGTGDWLDTSTNGFNATCYGNIAKNVDGNGIVFDGSTYWKFDDVYAGNRWTVNVWCKNITGNGGCILTQDSGYIINITVMQPDNGDLSINFYSPLGWSSGQSTSASTTVDTWVNVQGTWDGTTLSTYINGSLLGTATAGTAVSSTQIAPYLIGRRMNGNAYITGEIGEIRIYNYALSSTQVLADYNQSYSTFYPA